MKFNQAVHTTLITTWWRQYPVLAANLILSRGYNHPADWIIDLMQNPTVEIFEDGIYEIIDFAYGVKTAEAKVFIFGTNPQIEQQMKFKVCSELYQRQIKVIEIPSLMIRYEKIEREQFQKGLEGFRKLNELMQKGEKEANEDVLHTPTTSTTDESRSDKLPSSTVEELHDNSNSSETTDTDSVPTTKTSKSDNTNTTLSTTKELPTTSTNDSNIRTNVKRTARRKRPSQKQSEPVTAK